jgi:hypothetical protein
MNLEQKFFPTSSSSSHLQMHNLITTLKKEKNLTLISLASQNQSKTWSPKEPRKSLSPFLPLMIFDQPFLPTTTTIIIIIITYSNVKVVTSYKTLKHLEKWYWPCLPRQKKDICV